MFTILNQAFPATEKLEQIAYILPDVEEIIKKNIRWAIFSNEQIYTSKSSDSILNFSYELVEKAKIFLLSLGATANFFSSNVEQVLQGKSFCVFQDLDENAAEVKLSSDLVFNKNCKLYLAQTLPDSETVLASLIKGDIFEEQNSWLFEYMDIYDEWRNEHNKKLADMYYQIGGNGFWIQYSYNENYIGQINNDVGDSGSVYVVSTENGVEAYVECY